MTIPFLHFPAPCASAMAAQTLHRKKTCVQRRAVTGRAGLYSSRPGPVGDEFQERQITPAVVALWSFWYKAALFSRGPVPSL
jgi:hypothetical protein